ncbi:MAG: hypothetical protein WCT49_02395 [Candidatus Paceibacterota bacterium]|jgi:hypothetical protein|nr:hypothetical protein [Candidatus Paceibacterota bacterium]
MKLRGFLQTSSLYSKELIDDNIPLARFSSIKADERSSGLILPPDPMENFAVKFLGPRNSDLKIMVSGVSNLEKDLREIVLEYNEHGWRPLHFLVLDYFCEKYQLELDIVHHESELIRKAAPFASLQVFRTILSGNWEPPPARRVPKNEHCQKNIEGKQYPHIPARPWCEEE